MIIKLKNCLYFIKKTLLFRSINTFVKNYHFLRYKSFCKLYCMKQKQVADNYSLR